MAKEAKLTVLIHMGGGTTSDMKPQLKAWGCRVIKPLAVGVLRLMRG